MTKVIYLGTTEGCVACSYQERLLETALKEHNNVILKVCNYEELPNWIKINIKLSDFPITILIKNNIIKYHFTGTMSVKKFNQLCKDINF